MLGRLFWNQSFVKMKKFVLMLVVAVVLLLTGCNRSGVVRYELIGGDPEIDYLEFLNDSMCRFVAPGPLTLVSPYTKHDDTYTILIHGTVEARLHTYERGKLIGEPPFFDGVWEKQ